MLGEELSGSPEEHLFSLSLCDGKQKAKKKLDSEDVCRMQHCG